MHFKTHDLPDTSVSLVRCLVHALVLRHLVCGVDETVGREETR